MTSEQEITSEILAGIDSHCHHHLESISKEELIDIRDKGVSGFCLGGYGPEEWGLQLTYADTFPDYQWFHSFGLHPWWILERIKKYQWGLSDFIPHLEELRKWEGSAHALGECGLDFFKDPHKVTAEVQAQIFSKQIELAAKWRKPMVLHIVRGHDLALSILRTHDLPDPPGLVHGFSGSWETAKSYLDLGFCISLGSALLQRGYLKLKKAIPSLPLNRILIETDSARQGKVGDKKDLVHIVDIANAIVVFRKESVADILSASRRNFFNLFKAQESF